jgi:hypothetical protein
MKRATPLSGASLAVLLAVSLPLSAQQRIALRAGEHGDFSRIALDIPSLEAWDLRQTDRLVRLRFPDRDLSFDTSAIFPQRRVSRVTRASFESKGGGVELTLSLSCDCTVEAYEFQSDMLVVDIRDDQDGGATSDERRRAARSDGDGARQAEASGSDGPVEAGVAAVSRPDAAEEPAAREARPESEPAAIPTSPEAEDLSVDTARARLLEQLSRAADQGLVEFREPPGAGEPRTKPLRAAPVQGNGPKPDEAATPGAPDSDEAPNPARTPAQRTASSDPEGPVQLEARTAFDGDARPGETVDTPACDARRHLDPSVFSVVDAPYEALGELRGRVTGEFDKPDREAVLELVRMQISLGFGLEARRTLQAFAPQADGSVLLTDIARIVEGLPATPDGPLANAEGCGGRVALWRIAGRQGGATPASAQTKLEILQEFEALPVPMRRLAGPQLVRALVERDATDLAEALALRLDRAPGDHGDDWRLATAGLALAVGNRALAEARLEPVISDDGPLAARALLLLANSRLERNELLDPQLISDLGAAAFANRGTDLGRRLLIAEALGHAGRGQLEAALKGLKTEIDVGRHRASHLETAVIAVLSVTDADEVGSAAYADAVLSHRGLIGSGPDFDAVRARVAEEMTHVGLPGVGRDLLEPALARGRAPARLAAALTETAMGRPERALGHITGLQGRRAAELRANALARQGLHDRAWAEIADFLKPDADARRALAWRGGDWNAASEAFLHSDPRGVLAAWMAGEREAPSETYETPRTAFLAPSPDLSEPELAASRIAISQAEAARTLIDETLDGG